MINWKSACTLLLASVVYTNGLCAPTAKKKPASKSTKPTAARGVKGTTQLAGDNGKMGITYTLGKGNDAVNFTLLSAEYHPTRIVLTDGMYSPGIEEKYLVLHFTLHNPNPQDYTANWATLRFTAIDSKDVNHTFTGNGAVLFTKEGTNESTQVNLRPAQKIAVKTAIRIPWDVSVPKLMVERPDVTPVLRLYFKPGEIKAVPAPFADPNDKTGSVALKEVTVEPDVYVPARIYDVKFVSGSYSPKVGDHEPNEGNQYFVAKFTFKNGTLMKQQLMNATVQTGVKTDDGEKTPVVVNDMLKAGRDDSVDTMLEPNEEYTCRVLIQIPNGTKVKQLRLVEGDDTRTIVFNIGG